MNTFESNFKIVETTFKSGETIYQICKFVPAHRKFNFFKLKTETIPDNWEPITEYGNRNDYGYSSCDYWTTTTVEYTSLERVQSDFQQLKNVWNYLHREVETTKIIE